MVRIQIKKFVQSIGAALQYGQPLVSPIVSTKPYVVPAGTVVYDLDKGTATISTGTPTPAPTPPSIHFPTPSPSPNRYTTPTPTTPTTIAIPEVKPLSPRQEELKVRASKQEQLRKVNQTTNIRLKKSGGVQVGEGIKSHTYIGKAYIKEVGMTANEYRESVRKRLIAEGYDKEKLKRGRYSVTTQIEEEELDTGEEKPIQPIKSFNISESYKEHFEVQPYQKAKSPSPNRYTTPTPTTYISDVPVNPLTGQPYSVISKDTSLSFKTLKEERGFFGAVASYIPTKISEKSKEYQYQRASRDPSYQLYQPEATERLLGLGARIAQYSIPVLGTALLIGEGGETLISGRATKQYESMIEEGKSKVGSIALSYGVPVTEVGLGLLGVKLDISRIKNIIRKEPTIKFIATIKRGERGVSDVKVLSQEGKTISISSEKVISVPETDLFFGAGKGFRQDIVKSKYGDISKISEFQVLGTGKKLGSAKLVQEAKGLKLTIEDVGAGVISKGYQRDTGKVFEARRIWNPFYGKGGGVETRLKFLKESPSQFVKQDVLGVIKPKDEGVLSFIGTTKPKIRVYREGRVSYIIKKPDITGKIYVVQQEEEAVKVLITGAGERTPFSKTFLTQEEKLSVISQIPITKTATKESISSVKINPLTGNVIQTQEAPLMTGGTGLSNIPYSGLGQYEVQETGMGLISPVKTKLDLFEDVEYKRKVVPVLKSILDVSQIEEQKFIQPIKTALSEITKEDTRQRFIPSLRSAQEQKQEEKIKQAQRLTSIFNQIKEKYPIIIPFESSSKLSKGLFKGKSEGESFFAYGKRFGKDILLSKTPSTKEKASKELEKFLKLTLGASGFVKGEKGEKIPFKELGLSLSEFRPAKKDLYRAVQKLGGKEGGTGRLSSRFEILEIQKAKRGKKVKWL